MKVATKNELRKALYDLRDRIMGGWEPVAVCDECGAPLFENDAGLASVQDYRGCWGAALGWDSPHADPSRCYRYRMVENQNPE